MYSHVKFSNSADTVYICNTIYKAIKNGIMISNMSFQ